MSPPYLCQNLSLSDLYIFVNLVSFLDYIWGLAPFPLGILSIWNMASLSCAERVRYTPDFEDLMWKKYVRCFINNSSIDDQCMLSHVIWTWSATWSVAAESRDQGLLSCVIHACSAPGVLSAGLQDSCLLSHGCQACWVTCLESA